MELTLKTPDCTTTHETEITASRGDYFLGTLRFEFRGAFPVDPVIFMEAIPMLRAPGDTGFRCYEIRPPEGSVSFSTGSHYYLCRVESVRSDGFTLAPYMAGNLGAQERVKILPLT